MESPVLNTWQENQSAAEISHHTIRERFPGLAPKALMGWQGVMIFDPDVDPVGLLNAYLKRVAAESCGQCTPCRLGSARLAEIMETICAGNGSEQDLDRIRSLAVLIGRAARCDIGKTMAKPVCDLLDNCRQAFFPEHRTSALSLPYPYADRPLPGAR